jgi:outer membrane biosynthesis protein TonB
MTLSAWGLGLMVVMMGGAVSAEPAASGLAALDQALGSTGKVGTYTPHAASSIEPAPIAPDSAARVPELPTERAVAPSDRTEQPAVLSEEEVRRTEAPVNACRIEVARRRQISPQKLPARQVIVRFTVEPNGRVRDAETISAPATDLEIAACAKRVLSEWLFAKHARGEITLERTYQFH